MVGVPSGFYLITAFAFLWMPPLGKPCEKEARVPRGEPHTSQRKLGWERH